MSIGNRSRRVTIEKRGPGQDDFGQAEGVWLPLRTTWADIQPLTGGLLAAAQSAVPEASVQIEIRYRDDVVAGMRVRYGARLFIIAAPPIDLQMRHETLRLICTEGADRGV